MEYEVFNVSFSFYTDEVLQTPFFPALMSRDRFLLLSFLHISDNTFYIPRGKRGYNPILKLGTFYHGTLNK